MNIFVVVQQEQAVWHKWRYMLAETVVQICKCLSRRKFIVAATLPSRRPLAVMRPHIPTNNIIIELKGANYPRYSFTERPSNC
jgi:hypothetical protein